MRLKDNLEAVKTQLNTEEQFLGSLIKGEKFIRKYKIYILAILIALIAWFLGNFINSKLSEQSVIRANEIYASLLKNTKNETLLNELKEENINLYAVFLLKEVDLNDENFKNKLKDLSQNSEINSLLKDIIYLHLSQKSKFLKDYEKISQAYELLKNDKIEQANVLLAQIKENSILSQISKNLKHYQGISQ